MSKKSERMFELIAFIAESYFRRGYQQGVKFASDGKVTEDKACQFRYTKRRTLSPPHNPQGFRCSPSDRLKIELGTSNLPLKSGEKKEFYDILESI